MLRGKAGEIFELFTTIRRSRAIGNQSGAELCAERYEGLLGPQPEGDCW